MLVGYQTNFTQLKLGMLFFNHQSCSTTLALEVEQFTDLYGGPVFNVARTGTEQCLGHCSSCEDLTPCTVECACA